MAAENKNGKLYFDSACTPTSFVKEMPLNFKAKKGVVSTASGAKITTLGSGKVKFGELTVDATYGPSFSKNLISGIDIMNRGYATGIKEGQIVIASDIIIPEKDKVYATGKLSNGLLALDSKVDPSTINKFFAIMNSIFCAWSQKGSWYRFYFYCFLSPYCCQTCTGTHFYTM